MKSIAKIVAIYYCRSLYRDVVVWKIYFYEAINKPSTLFANFEVPSRKNVFGVWWCRSHIIREARHLCSWKMVNGRNLDLWLR